MGGKVAVKKQSHDLFHKSVEDFKEVSHSKK